MQQQMSMTAAVLQQQMTMDMQQHMLAQAAAMHSRGLVPPGMGMMHGGARHMQCPAHTLGTIIVMTMAEIMTTMMMMVVVGAGPRPRTELNIMVSQRRRATRPRLQLPGRESSTASSRYGRLEQAVVEKTGRSSGIEDNQGRRFCFAASSSALTAPASTSRRDAATAGTSATAASAGLVRMAGRGLMHEHTGRREGRPARLESRGRTASVAL